MTKLSELAKTIRSKNAGVDKITFDVIFTDRGPYVRNRQLDVSFGAARRLGLVNVGTAPVLIEKL